MKVLVTISDIEQTDAIVRFLKNRGWTEDPEFMVFAVTAPHITDFGACFPTHETRLNERLVNSLVRALKSAFPKHNVSGRVETGQPDEAILRTARQWEAQLIVMGSCAQHGYEDSAKCQLVTAVKTLLPCPLEIVPGDCSAGQDEMEEPEARWERNRKAVVKNVFHCATAVGSKRKRSSDESLVRGLNDRALRAFLAAEAAMQKNHPAGETSKSDSTTNSSMP